MPKNDFEDYVLAFDLGPSSVGWAVLPIDKKGEPIAIAAAGSRIFDAGVEGDMAKGSEEPRNLGRRNARLQRRQTARRARRRAKIFHCLQRFGLLPEGPSSTSAERHALLDQLDSALKTKYENGLEKSEIPGAGHVLPYLLRAKAVREPLEPHAAGRALYHLSQRRGYLSNRKTEVRDKKENEEEGKVSAGIGELREKMAAGSAPTLGAYFANLNPARDRIRQRWTARQMYSDEFEAIWTKQSELSPELFTPERKKQLYRAIFLQRPLKIRKDFIGDCELERGAPDSRGRRKARKRAPLALLDAQRFRLLQKVNDLRVIDPNGVPRDLTADERAAVAAELEQSDEATFPKLKKVLGVSRYHHFNLENGGETKLLGNRTNAKLAKIFGQRWNEMDRAAKDAVVEDIRSIQKPEALEKRGRGHWKLNADDAKKLSKVRLEPGYASLSRLALKKLLSLMENGVQFATARKQLYGEALLGGNPLDRLPPVREAVPSLRNPAVERSLTELRRVTNCVLRKFGKPAIIRLEMARDLKNPRKKRKEISANMRANERSRVEAAKIVARETGDPHPSRRDIEKVLLHHECGGVCPFTGRSISIANLLGPEPEFDIEHIIPFSRSLDNSFVNKTLCHVGENRDVKRNRTPREAYGQNPERWNEIIQRVKRFASSKSRAKLERFQMDADRVEGFTTRHLNDTRYTSRLAAEYLGLLFGGVIDANSKRRVQASTGSITAELRREWDLHGILGDGQTSNGGATPKNRDDHRHHALDAIVIGFTTARMVQVLSNAAQYALQERRRRFAPIQTPWPNFVDNVRGMIDSVVVSHRVNRRLSGALHEETFYSKPFAVDGKRGKPEFVHDVRKKLEALSATELNDIVDPVVAAAVQAKLAEIGGDPKKFAVPVNLPVLPNKRGEPVPIRKARIRKRVSPVAIGAESRERQVLSGNNSHVEIVARLDDEGKEIAWEGHVVSLLDAIGRRRRSEPVVRRDHGPGKRFLFSLTGGDVFEADWPPNGRQRFIVRTFSGDVVSATAGIEFVMLQDARPKTGENSIKEAKEWFKRSPNALRKLGCQKLCVNPLGEVSKAHD